MPGGFMRYPPDAILRELEKRIPELPAERFATIAAMYFVEYGNKAEPASEVRTQMERISDRAGKLWAEIGTLSEEAQDALWEGARQVGAPDIAALDMALYRLMVVARQAATSVGDSPPGRPRSALAAAVSRLAGVFEGLGIPIDKRPNGGLVLATELLLQSYKHSTSAALKAVARHVDKTRAAKGL